MNLKQGSRTTFVGWVASNALWAAGAFFAWQLTVYSPAPQLSGMATLMVGLLVTAVSFSLRLPLMIQPATTSTTIAQVHASWLLGMAAQLNWFGFIAPRSPHVVVAFELAFFMVLVEVWVAISLVHENKLGWLSLFRENLKLPSSKLPSSKLPSSKVPSSELPAQAVNSARSDFSSSGEISEPQESQLTHSTGEQQGLMRQSSDGVDENGLRFLAGWFRVSFNEGQRQHVELISFCPAMSRIPQFDLEADNEELTIKVEHVTEVGARVVVKRRSDSEPIEATVEWFAQDAIAAANSHAPTRLP